MSKTNYTSLSQTARMHILMHRNGLNITISYAYVHHLAVECEKGGLSFNIVIIILANHTVWNNTV